MNVFLEQQTIFTDEHKSPVNKKTAGGKSYEEG